MAKEFYINQPVAGNTSVKRYVEITDLNYFCNKSWTVSFNFITKSWVSFHTYIPNFYIGENGFYYSGLNEGCDVTAIAVTEIPSPTTTTTTTVILYCNLTGTAVYVPPPTTTTTSTSSTSTTSTTSTTSSTTSTTSTTTTTYCQSIGAGAGCFGWYFTAGSAGAIVQWTDCDGDNQSSVLSEDESGSACLCDGESPNVLEGSLAIISQVGQCNNIFISLATTATCSDDPCFNAGTTSWPCSGRVAINLTNPPSPYTITISYYNTPSGGTGYASLVYVGGLPYVDLGFDSSGSQLGVTATLKNGAGATVATSTTVIYSPNFIFNSGLPPCSPPCTCKQGTITDNNAFSYTDCAGVFQSGSLELGSEVCVNIQLSYSANIGNLIDFVGCQCS